MLRLLQVRVTATEPEFGDAARRRSFRTTTDMSEPEGHGRLPVMPRTEGLRAAELCRVVQAACALRVVFGPGPVSFFKQGSFTITGKQ